MAHHVVSTKVYYLVFAALLVLTGITVAVASVDLGPVNTAVAVAIAICKATLVALYFMHVRYSHAAHAGFRRGRLLLAHDSDWPDHERLPHPGTARPPRSQRGCCNIGPPPVADGRRPTNSRRLVLDFGRESLISGPLQKVVNPKFVSQGLPIAL